MQILDIVIPVYGQSELLDKCLEVLPRRVDINVIVIDDCTPKPEKLEVERIVREKYHLPLYKTSSNVGFGQTINKGVGKGKAPLIMLLNTDVVLKPSAVDGLLIEMEDTSVGIAAPMLVFPEKSQWGNEGKIQHVGMAFSVRGQPYHLFVGWSADNPRAVQRRDNLSCVTGACFMTRRALWNNAGGFQQAYGRGTFEDVEYCLVVKYVMKKKIVVNPLFRGVHYVGASSSAIDKPFDLQSNQQVFGVRMKQFVRHDEYLFW